MPNRPGTDVVPYKKNKRGSSGILPILLAVLLVAGLTGLTWYFTRDDGDASTNQPDINILVTPSGCDKDVVATAALKAQGFVDGQFVIGEQNIKWDAPEANERSSTVAFSDTTPTSAIQLTKGFETDTNESRAQLAALREESGATNKQLQNPGNWVAAQLTVESNWEGNTAFQNGKAVPVGTRKSDSGDVAWIFVNPAKCKDGAKVVDVVTAHRAGCGNPQTALPRPTRPVNPTPPPPSGEQGKDHRTSPSTIPVVHCPDGQVLDRNTQQCVAWPPSTTTTVENPGQGDGGDGATNTTTPPTTSGTAPPPPTTSPPTTAPPTPTVPPLD